MFKVALILLSLLLLALPVAGQADDKPTVAMLRFGSFISFTSIENAILDTMLGTGLVSEAEHARLRIRENLDGERINVHWNDANYDFSAVNAIVEDAMDRGAIERMAALGMDDETIELVLEALKQMAVGGGETELDLPDDIKAKVIALSASQRRMDDVSAILASLHCTPEMIAEQQTALEAGE